jgi:hypothetical protein
MKIPESVLMSLKERAEKIAYGRISIELNEMAKTVDIIVEERVRFLKQQEEPRAGKLVVRAVTRQD